MCLDHSGVKEYCSDTDDFLFLKFREYLVHHSALTPPLESHVYGVPIAIRLRELSPGTTRGEHVQNGIEHFSVSVPRRSCLLRKNVCDGLKLCVGEHIPTVYRFIAWGVCEHYLEK